MRAPAALLLAGALALACRPAPPPAAPAGVAAPETAAAGAADAASGTPCYRVLAMPDERQRRLECGNGDTFTLRLAADGQWYPEMKARAGAVPGHASPEAAGKALCRCP